MDCAEEFVKLHKGVKLVLGIVEEAPKVRVDLTSTFVETMGTSTLEESSLAVDK